MSGATVQAGFPGRATTPCHRRNAPRAPASMETGWQRQRAARCCRCRQIVRPMVLRGVVPRAEGWVTARARIRARGREPPVGVMARVRGLARSLRPVDPEFAAALARRWAGLPEAARTPGQTLGRHGVGCEGTHGVFPKCNLACAPCYHSRDANQVRVDGRHTL